MISGARSRSERIEDIIALARAKPDAANPPDFAQFLTAWFGDAHPEHLAGRGPEVLLAIARCHHALAASRLADDVRIAVYPADYPAPPGTWAVATVAADIPFLVDSVAIAVRDAGGTPDWLLHPVLRIRRDAQGRLLTPAESTGTRSQGDEESFIHLQFTAPPGFKADALKDYLARVLADLRTVVADFDVMSRQLRSAGEGLDCQTPGVDTDECAEAHAFLHWLAEDHFTFLGYRKREVVHAGDGEDAMVGVPGSSLGLLREDRPGVDPHGYVAPAEELDKYAQSPRLVVVTKANHRAWLHRAEIMDVIAVKRLDAQGHVIGAHRFLGLFSADAYAASPREIPMLRRKLAEVVERAAFRAASHSAKTLHYVLEQFPRDELFQSSEQELFDAAMGMVALRESQRLRLFLRRDRYGRYYAALVYIPRERYSLTLRRRIGLRLAELLEGDTREARSQFLRGDLVRAYYIMVTSTGAEVDVDLPAVEAELQRLTRSWQDDFQDALAAAARPDDDLAHYADAFPGAYTDRHAAAEAVADALEIQALCDNAPVLRLIGEGENLAMKLYGRGPEPALADVLPMLENFGLRAISQRPYAIRPAGGRPAWIHEFRASGPPARSEDAARLEAAFSAAWAGQCEDDGLNRLVLAAGLDVRAVSLLRAITRYLLQTPLPFSHATIESQLAAQPDLVASLVKLFHARFAPPTADAVRARRIEAGIHAALDAVASLDADRMLRAFLAVVMATLRSNYFQRDADGCPKPWISLKLDAGALSELPEPRPRFETFVYAPQVEGIHLRAGKVARGGLRWSDRREDFRTEVLGLMKTQVIKNAVIVPVGAKGGFVVKGAREGEQDQARGIACYQTYIRGLLDVTDNLDGDRVVPPPDTVCHDDDDAYLVVAADKGTAGFSDHANAIAREYGYWLDDAFASGGKTGYDHKAMGITARGAWLSVERHFRELGRDVHQQALSVVGIGDMGGDVFGNGMLLSPQIRLLAAFNHRHIFIDPQPDPERSFTERQRLFAQARGWDAYDPALLSAGGGIHERSEKVIELSPAARAALGMDAERMAPNELIRALLTAPVDLLWNGGIGTYVKAHHESHADVGDRANDNLRVDGRALRCKAVGEGGNLGFTQAARVEYARAGGRLNTDAIDNSGGVNSSDLEVNIKIALAPLVADGRLSRQDRDSLLAGMTAEVAALVLRTNRLQTQLISVLEGDAPARLDEHVEFIRALEREGQLERTLDGLPDEDAVEERYRNNAGLTRPELAVLVSHAKIALYEDVLGSDLPDDEHLDGMLLSAFPPTLRESHGEAIRAHRLRREIIATHAVNVLVDRMGVTLAHRVAAERGVARAAVVRAWLLVSDVFDAESAFADIEALEVAPNLQYRLLKRVAGLLKLGVTWVVAHPGPEPAMAAWLARYQDGAAALLDALP
ncbi:MAG: NAD-glutamate dehydrogenase, partial [Salinisphaera sp.]|nr:NAD-glutamate dehydrogenase [Salinisphaera sp.]